MKPLILLTGYLSCEEWSRQQVEQQLYEMQQQFNHLPSDDYDIRIIWLPGDRYELKCVFPLFTDPIPYQREIDRIVAEVQTLTQIPGPHLPWYQRFLRIFKLQRVLK